MRNPLPNLIKTEKIPSYRMAIAVVLNGVLLVLFGTLLSSAISHDYADASFLVRFLPFVVCPVVVIVCYVSYLKTRTENAMLRMRMMCLLLGVVCLLGAAVSFGFSQDWYHRHDAESLMFVFGVSGAAELLSAAICPGHIGRVRRVNREDATKDRQVEMSAPVQGMGQGTEVRSFSAPTISMLLNVVMLICMVVALLLMGVGEYGGMLDDLNVTALALSLFVPVIGIVMCALAYKGRVSARTAGIVCLLLTAVLLISVTVCVAVYVSACNSIYHSSLGINPYKRQSMYDVAEAGALFGWTVLLSVCMGVELVAGVACIMSDKRGSGDAES